MSIRYIELVEYLAIAAEVTGLDVNTLTRVAKIDLAESALHAPAAGFGATSSSWLGYRGFGLLRPIYVPQTNLIPGFSSTETRCMPS